nr:reverse transcriptase domain-containing protein [Tanacetum cinerariifolium]
NGNDKVIRRNEARIAFNNKDGLVSYRAQGSYQGHRDQGHNTPTKRPGEHKRKGRREIQNYKYDDKKQKLVERDESWKKTPIVFPPLSMEETSDEPLIIEAIMEGYLVRRVYVDHGALCEVMFKHCFKNLSPAMKSRLRSTQMDLVGFAGGVVKPIGKIELVVVFSDGGLFRRIMINFIVGSQLWSLGQWIVECRRLEQQQMVEKENSHNTLREEEGSERVDYYPLPYIDGKIESVVGFRYKCFLDAYKGYHQVQMALDDEEKTTFYTDHGTCCYTKMSFKLKNKRATYQRLVDMAFQSKIGRNLEAYVDDMIIKTNDEKVLIVDIAETFDNLRRINMKLNLKQCSFGVEEGKFLRYMVTSKGIRANPKKTKAVADMQSPWTLKEMQSLSGKKGVSGNEEVHSRAIVVNHPCNGRNDVRVSGSGNGGRECGVADKKKGKAMSDTLCQQDVFRGSPHQSHNGLATQANTKQSSSVREADQILGRVGSVQHILRAEKRHKSPSGVEFTYALLLNFTSTNNEAEYEALLARLRMARKMKVQDIDVKVDLKLVVSQINKIYLASSTSMIKHLATTKECIAEFKSFAIQNIPRNLNQKASILKRSIDRKEVSVIVEEEEDNWMTPIIRCLAVGVWPKDNEEMKALRMKINQEDENADDLCLNMDLLQERREATTIREAKYKTKIERYYNQKVSLMSFKPDEYVYRRNEASRLEDQGKLGPKWEGPYRVTEAYQNGSYKLQIMEGKEVPWTWHTINLRKCYV